MKWFWRLACYVYRSDVRLYEMRLRDARRRLEFCERLLGGGNSGE